MATAKLKQSKKQSSKVNGIPAHAVKDGPAPPECPHCHHELDSEWVRKMATWALLEYPEWAAKVAGHAMIARRKTPLEGHPKVLRRCKYCGKEFGGREMRAHVPRCPART